MKPYFYSIISLCLLANAYGQSNVLVNGNIINPNKSRTIEVHLNQSYINGDIIIYESEIYDDGYFSIDFALDEPQLVKIIYGKESTLLYLEPGDALHLSSDGTNFRKTLGFSGHAGPNNILLAQFLQLNPRELNPFKLIQFRQGIHWYAIGQEMNSFMQRTNPEEFKRQMDWRKAQALHLISKFDSQNAGQLTNLFKEFLNTEIIYYWAYHLLMYGNVYKNRYNISPNFFDFMAEVPIQSDYLANNWYQQYLKAFVNHKYLRSGSKEPPYAKQYDLGSENLSGRPLAYLRSELIQKGLLKEQISEMLPKYLHYLENNSYTEFDDKVLEAYEKVRKYSVGAKAPEFSLKDAKDETISLQQFRGKVIFLNFWASWCRPCIRKMNALKPIIDEMENLGVVFLNVSLDKSEQAWQQSLRQGAFKGIHLIAKEGIEAVVAKKYDVKAIPKYFIINKQGNFARKPPTNNLDALKKVLQRYLSEN